MKYLDLTFADSAANLACDEVLLNHCEANDFGEVLRLWEPADYFIVLGYSNKAAAEVDLAACAERGIPVYRRFSGGGAVLQGPGCLNYSLVTANQNIATRAVAESFRTVLQPHQEVFSRLLGKSVRIAGISDLATGGKKFSGNSQHRKTCHTLFHGTFLLNLDFSVIEATLRMPSKQPPYRRQRPHGDFLINVGIDGAEARRAIRSRWGALDTLRPFPFDAVRRTVLERYSQHRWNFKF